MEMLENDETLDRLSDLNESLIFLILSFLPMRDVVRTTILSKRWEGLWLTLPCLNFHELHRRSVDSRNFINRALMLWNGAKIKKLEFTWSPFDRSLYGDMDLWMCFAKERKVEELYIQILYESPRPEAGYPGYHPPQSLYSCSSITKLSLFSCSLQIRGNVLWPQLKYIKLHGNGFTESMINQVVSSCPLLETLILRLYDHGENLSFQSTSLKMLSIYTSTYGPPLVLTICAPNLEALVISGVVYDKCLLTDISSVTDATLDFLDKWPETLEVTLREIITTFHELHHLQAVTLSACCYKMLTDMVPFSPLMDVKLLRFDGVGEPHEIVGLFKIFPKLERLVIDWKLDYNDYINVDHLLLEYSRDHITFDYTYTESLANMLNPFLMQLKTVEISWYFYEASIFQFVEILLKHAVMIEKIVIRKRDNKMLTGKDSFSSLMDVTLLRFGGIGESLETSCLFKIFPKLEKLVIDLKLEHHVVIDLEIESLEEDTEEMFDFHHNYLETVAHMLKPFLMKTVEISWYFYEVAFFQFVELLLKHGAMIKKIVIQKRGNNVISSEDMLAAAEKVESLQRSFPDVEMVSL